MPLHFYKHNYLGPGTDKFDKKPLDRDDRIALFHDIKYELATSHKDIFEADKQAIAAFGADFIQTGNWHSAVGFLGIGTKHIVEKIHGKSLYGLKSRGNKEELEGCHSEDDLMVQNIATAKCVNEQPRKIRNRTRSFSQSKQDALIALSDVYST